MSCFGGNGSHSSFPFQWSIQYSSPVNGHICCTVKAKTGLAFHRQSWNDIHDHNNRVIGGHGSL